MNRALQTIPFHGIFVCVAVSYREQTSAHLGERSQEPFPKIALLGAP